MRPLLHRILATAGIVGIVATGLAAPVAAMGSGNPYADMQAGVTYTVYQPTYGAGLKLQHAGGNTLCPEGTEQNLLAVYGTRATRQFTITEGNPMCSDIGVGQVVQRLTVHGARAEVVAYCDPRGQRKCTKADVARVGGHVAVTLPATAGLRPTIVWVETFSAHNLTAKQLVRIARSLVPVSG